MLSDLELKFGQDPEGNALAVIAGAVDEFRMAIEDALVRNLALTTILLDKGILTPDDLVVLEKLTVSIKAEIEQKQAAGAEQLMALLDKSDPELAQRLRKTRNQVDGLE